MKVRGPWRSLWPVATFAVLIALQLFWAPPGPVTIDEVTYQRMTQELVHGGGFFIHNGYEEVPSPELTSMFIVPNADGKLAAQYPYGSAVLGGPLYVLFGLRGAFFLNALALALSLALCYRIAWQLLRDHWICAASVAVVASTYFVEYGLASWPHATAVACVLGAFSLGVDAHRSGGNSRRAWIQYLASGVIVGVGTTLRLDTVLCVPAILAPPFFVSPTRVRAIVSFVVGMCPGLLFVAYSNYSRWGGLSPMSYGPTSHSPSVHVPFFIGGVALIAGLWIVSRPRVLARVRPRSFALGSVLLLLLAWVLLSHHRKRDVIEIMTSVHALLSFLFDLRLRPEAIWTPDESLAVVYAGALKKALLQSVPFLVLIAVPVAAAFRDRDKRAAIAWLLAVPAVRIGFFGVLAWHGGLGTNLRYILSSLVFLGILVAYALRDLTANLPRRWLVLAVVPLVAVAAFHIAVYDWSSLVPDERQEMWVLTGPVVLALVLLALVIAWIRTRRASLQVATVLVTAAAFGWSIGATIEDVRWGRYLRSYNYTISECIADRIPDGSLLISEFPNSVYGVAARLPHVAIALPINDTFETTRELIGHYRTTGHRAFAAVGPLMWKLLRWHGVLDGYRVDAIAQIGSYVLGEIRPARPGEVSKGVFADVTGWPAVCGPSPILLPTEFEPRFGPDLVRVPR